MSGLFPHANLVAGGLVLIVGFVFHWVGQLFSILNWELAVRLGLQEKDLPPEYKVYEQGTAVADVLIAWVYGIAGAGLLFGTSWGFKLAWIPGAILLYHALSFWFWTANRKRAGYAGMASPLRAGWFLANALTGLLTLLVAWHGC